MEIVPNIISIHDLASLSNMFYSNFIAAKEINHFIEEVKDREMKEILEDAVCMHTEHCKAILSILQGGFRCEE